MSGSELVGGARLEDPRSVLELIRQTILAVPEQVAIESPVGSLSYRDFGRRVGGLATRLGHRGVVSGQPVGVLARPSAQGIIGIIGVVMAGAAYLPLCPSLPIERLRAMIQDAGVTLVVRADGTFDHGPLGVTTLPVMDADDPQGESPELPVRVWPDAPISVIYTSGSSGTPKGVMISHRGLVNRVLWGQRVYPLASSDRVLQHTRYSYDFSAWEVFATLSYGATLVAPELANYPDFTELAESINRFRVTTAHFVPSVLSGVIEREAFTRCTSLQRVFSGGEALTNDLARRFSARSDAMLFNQYGPTETCIDSTFYRYADKDSSERTVPIGDAIDDTRLYVLDDRLEAVLDSVEGELYIAGPGVALGYVGRPDLTAERFLPDVFGSDGGRMYRTGDVVVRNAAGQLVFRGRTDLQENIRGVRVELEEVESILSLDPDVERAVALVTDEHSPALVAMVFAARDAVIDTGKLREAAKRRLPAAFVPDQIFQGEKLPLLSSGKIDRNGVRALVVEARRASRAHAAVPSNSDDVVEAFVAGVWREQLGIDELLADRDFFDLGGHSLMAVEMVSVVSERLGVEVALADFFESPRIETVVKLVKSAQQEADFPMTMPAVRPEDGDSSSEQWSAA